jgi:hypothetical protein
LLAIDAFDDLLSNDSFVVDSEDTLLQTLLALKSESLLLHIWYEEMNVQLRNARCDL